MAVKRPRKAYFLSKNGRPIFDVVQSRGLSEEEALANARLVSFAPMLLQIAEMYFDTMRSRGETESIPFKITLDALSSILEEGKTDTK